ncbi:unnamed protein product [Clonostachys rosea f. rosea IK726]|uniref:Uncharacterized protein n=1 Tax=Clonostachys rosea f. rosea IK726 TaxID=1349383 RepID=A0ACA9UNQ5_BIOOC|nr:unnamed protein product [Clonostachys rosea f. rosea IK726]
MPERAQDVVQQGYWLQNAFTQRSAMGKLIARYFMPALGSLESSTEVWNFALRPPACPGLKTPRRPRAVPFEDELPAKPVKNPHQIGKLASVAVTMCLCALGADLVHVPKRLDLAIDALCSMNIPRASILPVITFVVKIASLLAMALVESNRIGNKLTSWVLIAMFAIVNNFLGPGAIGPLAALFAHWSCGLIVGRHVPVEAARMILPIVAVGYILPAIIAVSRMDSTSIMIWKNAPIICFMLARSLLPLSSPSGSHIADDEKLKLHFERERTHNMFAKADLPYIRLVHYSAFLVSAATQLINVYHHGSLVNLTLTGKNARLAILGFSRYDDLAFTLSSLVLALGAAPLGLRLHGYITTSQSFASALFICLALPIVGPTATIAGMAIYRESILAGFGQ